MVDIWNLPVSLYSSDPCTVSRSGHEFDGLGDVNEEAAYKMEKQDDFLVIAEAFYAIDRFETRNFFYLSTRLRHTAQRLAALYQSHVLPLYSPP